MGGHYTRAGGEATATPARPSQRLPRDPPGYFAYTRGITEGGAVYGYSLQRVFRGTGSGGAGSRRRAQPAGPVIQGRRCHPGQVIQRQNPAGQAQLRQGHRAQVPAGHGACWRGAAHQGGGAGGCTRQRRGSARHQTDSGTAYRHAGQRARRGQCRRDPRATGWR